MDLSRAERDNVSCDGESQTYLKSLQEGRQPRRPRPTPRSVCPKSHRYQPVPTNPNGNNPQAMSGSPDENTPRCCHCVRNTQTTVTPFSRDRLRSSPYENDNVFLEEPPIQPHISTQTGMAGGRGPRPSYSYVPNNRCLVPLTGQNAQPKAPVFNYSPDSDDMIENGASDPDNTRSANIDSSSLAAQKKSRKRRKCWMLCKFLVKKKCFFRSLAIVTFALSAVAFGLAIWNTVGSSRLFCVSREDSVAQADGKQSGAGGWECYPSEQELPKQSGQTAVTARLDQRILEALPQSQLSLNKPFAQLKISASQEQGSEKIKWDVKASYELLLSGDGTTITITTAGHYYIYCQLQFTHGAKRRDHLMLGLSRRTTKTLETFPAARDGSGYAIVQTTAHLQKNNSIFIRSSDMSSLKTGENSGSYIGLFLI